MFLFCYMLSILVLSVVYIYEINVESKREVILIYLEHFKPVVYFTKSSLSIFSLNNRLLVNIKYVDNRSSILH